MARILPLKGTGQFVGCTVLSIFWMIVSLKHHRKREGLILLTVAC